MDSEKENKIAKYIRRGVIAALVLLLFFLAKTETFSSAADDFKPVFYAVIISYILWPIVVMFERRVFYRVKSIKMRRILALVITYILFVTIIITLISGVIPQLGNSINTFQGKFDGYMKSLQSFIDNLPTSKFAFLANYQETLSNFIKNSVSWIVSAATGVLTNATGYLLQVFSEVKNLFFALFISIYYILYKENLFAQLKKLSISVFSEKTVNEAVHYVELVDHSFGGFLKGKLLDSAIIGVFCAVCMLIFKIPYVLLISIIVGITNIIPVIGPIIGAIPSSIILLMVQPDKVIIFVILIVVIQQIDGNLLGPAILSGFTSLNPLWIIVAVTVMSGLMGGFGMFLGVPTFAVIYDIVKENSEKSLAGKNLSVNTKDYYSDSSYIRIAYSDKNGKHRAAKVRKKEKFSFSEAAEELNDSADRILNRLSVALVSALEFVREKWQQLKAWIDSLTGSSSGKNSSAGGHSDTGKHFRSEKYRQSGSESGRIQSTGQGRQTGPESENMQNSQPRRQSEEESENFRNSESCRLPVDESGKRRSTEPCDQTDPGSEGRAGLKKKFIDFFFGEEDDDAE